jgi:NADPH:quinone reductase-like Zn-dependent oxidoreductase
MGPVEARSGPNDNCSADSGNFREPALVDLVIMRAAVFTRYGPPDVLQVKDVAKPVPKDNEVLVRATTVAAADWRIRKGDPFVARFFSGLWKPKRIQTTGMEFSGTVESTGSVVTRFKPGDEVFGGTLFKLGCQAEYVCLPEDGMIAPRPVNMTLDEAAAVFFGGMTVLGFLGNAPIEKGQKVLVYGASGSVGVFAVQLAKHFGAEVTAVCSTANLALVKSLGADAVLDSPDRISPAQAVYMTWCSTPWAKAASGAA